MAHYVFFSYSSRDKAIADAICNCLENRKIRCWIAPRDVLPGVPYPKAIMDAMSPPLERHLKQLSDKIQARLTDPETINKNNSDKPLRANVHAEGIQDRRKPGDKNI